MRGRSKVSGMLRLVILTGVVASLGLFAISSIERSRERLDEAATKGVEEVFDVLDAAKTSEDARSHAGEDQAIVIFERIDFRTCVGLVRQKERFDGRVVRINWLVVEPTDGPTDICFEDMRERVPDRYVGARGHRGYTIDTIPLNRVEVGPKDPA